MSGREAMWFGIGVVYGALLGVYAFNRWRDQVERVSGLQSRVWELEAKERERGMKAAPQPEAA